MNTSLYLFPLPPLQAPPDPRTVARALRRCGFLGEPLEAGRFRVGEGFFRYLTFAGCSPHLQLEPAGEGDRDFTHVRIFREAAPRLRIAPRRGRPRCPACRAAVPGWQEALGRWQRDGGERYSCSACGHGTSVAALDWRQYGVAARLLVEVTRVWPGEALPGDQLLAVLEAATGRRWSHAWAESS